jgi:lysyl-tRNA synthetase, class II
MDNNKDPDGTEYRELRLTNITPDMYPHKYQTTTTIPQFIATYKDLEKNSSLPDKTESIAGRVVSVNSLGKKLFFFKIESDNATVQLLVRQKEYNNDSLFQKMTDLTKKGDIIGATGNPGKSKTGELSLYVTQLTMLAPCLNIIPAQNFGLSDPEIRFNQRYLDLLVNKANKDVFVKRSKIIKTIRTYLDEQNFMEVETPVLSSKVGGANAKPFITHHNELKKDLYMRIAPELYLKQCLIAGFDRVYEIGKQFRNEGIDQSHNPEFTSLEFYMAYADYNDLMTMTEDLVSRIVMVVCGKLEVGTDNYIDFKPPYKKIDIVSTLEQHIGKLPEDLSTDEANKILSQLCTDRGIECKAPRTTARLLDKLIERYIEPLCNNPTFLMNHPVVMSPLAKVHRDNKYLTERFELFVRGFELANAYTELNDPSVQKERFLAQAKDRVSGDSEAQIMDEDYVTALEYGLAPCAGFGLGIDRLVMFLTGKGNIREVILFPSK